MLPLRVIFLIGLIALCGGCFKQTLATHPSWYAQESINKNMLVGFGNAKTLEAAKANALNDIITQLNVEVRSQFSQQTQRQDSQLKHTSSSDIMLKSADIQLNNIEYVKSTFWDNQFYVQAEVSKATLIVEFQKAFNNTYATLHSINPNKCPTLSIKEKTQLEQTLQKLSLYNTLLQTLGSKARTFDEFESILYANMPLPSAKLSIKSNQAHEKITNDLRKELGYFYRLENNASHTLQTEVSFKHIKPNHTKIDILFNIFDCHSNPIFSTNVSYEASNREDSLSFASQRVSVQLYKKIQEWIEN